MAEELKIISISIPDTIINDKVVFYKINVIGNVKSWVIVKRYSQFEEMHNLLQSEFSRKPLPKGLTLPPKKIKLIQSHVDPSFVEERRVLLENYLRKLVSNKNSVASKTFLRFVNSDKTNDQVTEKSELEMPEDVEVTDVSIPATRAMSDHVLYQIDVCNARKRKTFSKWTVLKRFGQFYEMDQQVRNDFVNNPAFLESLPTPPERKMKIISDHMAPEFIEERRALLEHYLKSMIKIEEVVRHPKFLGFLGVSI